jgi:peptidyl-prolyl cis-trans isomerase C
MLQFHPRGLTFSAVLFLTMAPAHAADTPNKAGPPDLSVTAATVNGTNISEYRVNKLVKDRAAKGQPDTPESRRKIIDQLALQLILSQEARKIGLDKSPELLDYIDLNMQSILATAFVQDYQRRHPIGEDSIKAEYEKFRERAAGLEYKARHILVASEAEARDIIAKLKASPTDFEALAKEHSKDPGSRVKGGDLGWFDPGTMVPEFSTAVVKLDKGRFTEEPIQSKFGYHVIVLEDSRPKAIPALDEVRIKLQRELQEQNLQKVFEDLKAKARIKIGESATATPAAATPATKGPASAKPGR